MFGNVLEKIKNMRGLFFRKIVEASERGEKEEIVLPGFSVQKPKRFVEFPDVKDITTVNVTYPLIEPFAYANIKWNPENKELVYNLVEPQMDEEDSKLLRSICDALIELVEVELSAIKNSSKAVEYIEKQVGKIEVDYQDSSHIGHIGRRLLGISITPAEVEQAKEA